MFKLDILIGLIAGAHIYFLILEMFFWTKPLGLKTFHMDSTVAKSSAPIAANMGLYNGFLAAGLLWGLMERDILFSVEIKTFFLVCVLVAGIFGAVTANKRILFVQALPALAALVWLRFF